MRGRPAGALRSGGGLGPPTAATTRGGPPGRRGRRRRCDRWPGLHWSCPREGNPIGEVKSPPVGERGRGRRFGGLALGGHYDSTPSAWPQIKASEGLFGLSSRMERSLGQACPELLVIAEYLDPPGCFSVKSSQKVMMFLSRVQSLLSAWRRGRAWRRTQQDDRLATARHPRIGDAHRSDHWPCAQRPYALHQRLASGVAPLVSGAQRSQPPSSRAGRAGPPAVRRAEILSLASRSPTSRGLPGDPAQIIGARWRGFAPMDAAWVRLPP